MVRQLSWYRSHPLEILTEREVLELVAEDGYNRRVQAILRYLES